MRFELPHPLVHLVLDFDPAAVEKKRTQHKEQEALMQRVSPEEALALLRQQFSGSVSGAVIESVGQTGRQERVQSVTGSRRHRRKPKPLVYIPEDELVRIFNEQPLPEHHGRRGKGQRHG